MRPKLRSLLFHPNCPLIGACKARFGYDCVPYFPITTAAQFLFCKLRFYSSWIIESHQVRRNRFGGTSIAPKVKHQFSYVRQVTFKLSQDGCLADSSNERTRRQERATTKVVPLREARSGNRDSGSKIVKLSQFHPEMAQRALRERRNLSRAICCAFLISQSYYRLVVKIATKESRGIRGSQILGVAENFNRGSY